MYNIEKRHETHAKQAESKRVTYPFAKMKVGDSFFVPDSDPKSKSVGSAACSYGRRHNVKFRSCKAEKHGELGVMVYIDGDDSQPLVVANHSDDDNYF